MLRRKLLTQHGLFPTIPALKNISARPLQTHASHSLALTHMIFAENHEDEATPAILNELAAHFYEMGYHEFYDEAPLGTHLQKTLKVLADSTEIYAELKRTMAAVNLDVNSEDQVKQFLLLPYIINNERVPKSVAAAFMTFAGIVHRQNSIRLYQQFFQRLEHYGFNYRGVDCHSDITTAHLEDVHARRDKQMAEAYLQAPVPVIGRIGLAHVEGMQAVMSANDSVENLAARFSFFYLYSKASTIQLNNMEQRAREGKLPLHWQMHAIDCSKTSKETVVAQIKEVMEERREDLQALARRAYRR